MSLVMFITAWIFSRKTPSHRAESLDEATSRFRCPEMVPYFVSSAFNRSKSASVGTSIILIIFPPFSDVLIGMLYSLPWCSNSAPLSNLLRKLL